MGSGKSRSARCCLKGSLLVKCSIKKNAFEYIMALSMHNSTFNVLTYSINLFFLNSIEHWVCTNSKLEKEVTIFK